MRKGIVTLGIVLIIVGLILAIVFYPMVGYASAEETSDEISELSIDSMTGKKVELKGTIDEVWTDEIPFVSTVFELVGLLVFTVDGLEVETLLGGLFGGDETVPVLIFSDNMDVDDGDEVTVEGYAFGWSDIAVIIGDSGLESVVKMSLGTPPSSAEVEICPHGGYYVGAVILIIGFILIIVGAVTKPKGRGQQYYQQPQGQPPKATPVSQTPTPPVAKPVQAESTPSPAPPPTSPSPQYPCRWCRQPMTFINQYQKWYCNHCQRYA